ncbi:hypothetical protein V5F77_18930 [Xanthobacter sp. DSM 24535]|uniref:hypothetical protein n=1 Tax=Roseixanthobacter psychrophilus TaxID=3119917 RepID=UPI003729FAA6
MAQESHPLPPFSASVSRVRTASNASAVRRWNALLAVCLGGMLLASAFTSARAGEISPPLNCAEAASIIARSGAAIIRNSPTTYDRYVRDGSFCGPDGATTPAFVPTWDNPDCFVGYSCGNFPSR